MPQNIEGKLDASGRKYAIVLGRFNSFVSEQLLQEQSIACVATAPVTMTSQ